MRNYETQMVLGVMIDKTAMPELYRLARTDGGTLVLVLRGIMRKRGFIDPRTAMKFLERDLGYKSASPQCVELPRCR